MKTEDIAVLAIAAAAVLLVLKAGRRTEQVTSVQASHNQLGASNIVPNDALHLLDIANGAPPAVELGAYLKSVTDSLASEAANMPSGAGKYPTLEKTQYEYYSMYPN